jgi:tRNA(fMet)-specific endonuclease VapC
VTRYLLDADLVIHASNGELDALRWLSAHASDDLVMSALVRAQVEAGVAADPALAPARRRAVDAVASIIRTAPFDEAAALAYGAIVAALGFSRRNAVDRMIAAHAWALGATVVTGNARDFAGVSGVPVESWRP